MILRIRCTKLGKIRFVGHRDLGRVWERALRRCDVPVAQSAGFTPRPRIAFGLALPMGAESLGEYVDVELRADAAESGAIEPERVVEDLDSMLPDGMGVLTAALLERPVTSLQECVVATGWELWAEDVTPEHVSSAVALLDRPEVPFERERKGHRRTDDVRPLISDLRPSLDGRRLVAELSAIGRALRPAELASLAFGHVDPLDVRVLRTHQWIDHDGVRREVLPLPAPVDATTCRVGA